MGLGGLPQTEVLALASPSMLEAVAVVRRMAVARATTQPALTVLQAAVQAAGLVVHRGPLMALLVLRALEAVAVFLAIRLSVAVVRVGQTRTTVPAAGVVAAICRALPSRLAMVVSVALLEAEGVVGRAGLAEPD